MSFGLSIALILLPFVLVAASAIFVAQRKQKAYLADDSPFAAKPYPPQRTPLSWLPRLSIAERLFLAERLKLAVILPLVLFYVFLMAGITSFNNGGPNAHLWKDPQALAWLTFLRMPGTLMSTMSIVWIITAFTAIQPLRAGPLTSVPWRLRPVSISFLFWSSILPVLLGELLAAAAGLLVAFAIFYRLHGPVWQHLPPVIPRVIGPDDGDVVRIYQNLRVSSPPHLLLSFLTTAMLTVASGVTLCLAPFNIFRKPSVGAAIILVPFIAAGPFAASVWTDISSGPGPIARFFFIDNTLGTPPPYAFVLVPITLTIVLLVFANHLAHRIDA